MSKIFKKIKQPILLVVLLTFNACASMTLKYQADLESNDHDEGTVSATKSVSTSGHAVGCGLTFWLYGGWCWAYLAMPFESQKSEMTDFVSGKIKARLHYPLYSLVDEQIWRDNWGQTGSEFSFKSNSVQEEKSAKDRDFADDDDADHEIAAESEKNKRSTSEINEIAAKESYQRHDDQSLVPTWRYVTGHALTIVGAATTIVGFVHLFAVETDGTDAAEDQAYANGECNTTNKIKCHQQRQNRSLLITGAGIGFILGGKFLLRDDLGPANKSTTKNRKVPSKDEASLALFKSQNSYQIVVHVPP